MHTNFFALEVCGAAHDAEQLQSMRQAQLPCFLRRCAELPDLRQLLARFFHQPITGGMIHAAATEA
jgi:hypothetical protein